LNVSTVSVCFVNIQTVEPSAGDTAFMDNGDFTLRRLSFVVALVRNRHLPRTEPTFVNTALSARTRLVAAQFPVGRHPGVIRKQTLPRYCDRSPS
jgi:hypothetical protein